MIAKIARSNNLYGALAYNQLKVDNEKGQVIFLNRIIETPNGSYSVAQLIKSFEAYLIANRKTEKPILHISLNPSPEDRVTDKQFELIAQQYMQQMGYGQQPFVVFKHFDIERTHIHIVSICVDEMGRKIADQFEKRRSMKVCRDLESKFGLAQAIDKKNKQGEPIFRPIDYTLGNVKRQIASIVPHVSGVYKFQTLGEYNALLSLFNLTVHKLDGELNGELKKGLLYIPLDLNGERVGRALKASLFGKGAGLSDLERHFAKSKESLKNSPSKLKVIAGVASAKASTSDEASFKKQLAEQNIDVIVRKSSAGRIYGMTFIDHLARSVWNGSNLGKEFSANAFNDNWNNIAKSQTREVESTQSRPMYSNQLEDFDEEKTHQLFEFLDTDSLYDRPEGSIIDALGSLLPQTQGEDYQEIDFAIRMKRKKYRPKQ